MTKLTDESPRLFRPTLAAWIGLNESIFLEQLHFILTEMEGRGRFADGQKWYRDTPRAFVVTYFPFWDESIVKRTIANLRADALIMARSDLNDDPKDRSLWYTINYPVLERLDGPVERITGKSAKRKEARKARKDKADSSIEYTKVQNVLIKNKGTNSTLESQQNVLLPQVQNVPTPKESRLPKVVRPKESSPQQKMYATLAELCHIELRATTEKQKGQLGNASKALVNLVKDLDQFKAKFPKYWQQMDWRGKQGQPPTPPQIQEVYGDYCHWLENGTPTQAQKASTKNGYHTKSTKRTAAQVVPPQADPDLYTRMQQAAIRAAADDP